MRRSRYARTITTCARTSFGEGAPPPKPSWEGVVYNPALQIRSPFVMSDFTTKNATVIMGANILGGIFDIEKLKK